MRLFIGSNLLPSLVMFAKNRKNIKVCNKEPNLELVTFNSFYVEKTIHSFVNRLEDQRSIETFEMLMGKGVSLTDIQRTLQ